MSKYQFDPKDDDEPTFMCFINTAIANELAEGNRLKRLELSHGKANFYTSDVSRMKKIKPEDLKDQA